MRQEFIYDPYNGEDSQPNPSEESLAENEGLPLENEADETASSETDSSDVEPVYEYELVRPRKQNRGLTLTVVSLLLVSLILFLVWNYAFRLENVKVIGLSGRNEENVIGQSGLVRGMNMFKASEENVVASIGKDHTLVYEGMQKDYAAHVIYLFVHERKAVAALYQFGSLFLLDDEGMVLTDLRGEAVPDGLVTITGMGGNGLKVGQMISGVTEEQMEAFRQVVRNVLPEDGILKVNLKDASSITAETANGLMLKLADSSYMSAKLKAYRYIRGFFLPGQKGILDLTIPEQAKFFEEK